MSKLEQELEKYSNKVESYLSASNSIGVVLLDSDLNILDSNLGFMRHFHPRQSPVGGQLSDYLELDAGDIQCDKQLKLPSSRKTGMDAINLCYLIRTDSGFLLFCEQQLLTESRVLEQIGSMNDELINLQRDLVKKNHLLEKIQLELNERITELESAFERIKRLEGIISICMYCKKIRNEQQSWEQLEKYITEHTDALFSHGICPTCLEVHFPQ